jgi:hypothetical protein
MSKETTAIYFAWFNQIAEDPTQSPAAFKLAFAYQQHINNDTGAAFVGQEKLASMVGVTDRTVRTLTEQLKAGGHLLVDVNHGPKQANLCRLVLNRKSASGLEPSIRKFLKPVIDGEPEAGFLINPEVSRIKTGSLAQQKRKQASDELSSNHDSSSSGAAPSSALGALEPIIQARIGRARFSSWFGQALITNVTSDVLTMEMPNKFIRDRVAQDFESDLLACCRSQHPTIQRVTLVVREAA